MFALPLHDLPTRSASGFLIRHVVPRSVPPHLTGPLDRKAVFSTLTIGDVVIAVGHGDDAEFCGHNNQVVMDTMSMPDVRDKIVVLISCETAKELGPALISVGACSYIGFKEDLVWVVDADASMWPWSDRIAELAMNPIVHCLNTILDGEPVGDAFNILTSDLQRNAEIEEDELIASCLKFNARNAVLLGDSTFRIRARPKVKFPIPPPPFPPLLIQRRA